MPTKTLNKSAWIRSQPLDTPAKELVAKAKKEGFKLSEAMVYTTRSEMKRKGGGGGKPKVLKTEGRPGKVLAGGGFEDMLRQLIREEIKSFFSER